MRYPSFLSASRFARLFKGNLESALQMSLKMLSKRQRHRVSRQTYPIIRQVLIHAGASLRTCSNDIQELFSKLRFSYLEQVTKEKFIRAIVSDPPLLVEHSQNVELESQLAEAKITLKKDKVEVADMIEDLGRRGRELCRKYDAIKLQTTRLRNLPDKIQGLEISIAKMKGAQAPDLDPTLNLPLHKTIALVEEKEKEAAELDHLLENIQTELLRKARDVERAETELQPLEIKRLASTAAAKEAKRRKDEALGGVGDELEERGRWWRGVESGLKVMLEADTK